MNILLHALPSVDAGSLAVSVPLSPPTEFEGIPPQLDSVGRTLLSDNVGTSVVGQHGWSPAVVAGRWDRANGAKCDGWHSQAPTSRVRVMCGSMN
eukprot:CAMPEP_0177324930 /NCGR_PEP_ID=MMETSP0368-20130122/17532_1 /TAXON_ID=447022 ORGANISM="Scrippsiella hangoei-like, Strain SHHI-4" /NCGR_SAMPLE_ID=MMETSP0368 /ASSEMBLY_ACC=CAM_ASM_000363 /LENGTH=94 /DNA_ID=CAMNT_0018784783 /DNA_START=262 /DNA_END=544 /DNA_ORIENTATION=+